MPGSSPDKAEAVVVETKVPAEIETKTPDVVASAESSPAETKVEDKGDMLSAVKAALKPTEKTTDSGEQGLKPDAEPVVAAKEGETAGTEPGDLSAEELAQLKPKTRARISNLLKDRSDRDEKIASLEPKVQQFDTLVRFVEDAGLSKDEVNQGFDVMRALKREPLRAYQVLQPIMAQLEQIVGVQLPDDLRNAVALGQITDTHARELSRSRATSTLSQQQLQEQTQRDQEQRKANEHQAAINDVSTKVSEWERSQEKSDPDWKLKQPRVMALVKLEVQDRKLRDPSYFPSVEEAHGFCKTALKTVTDEIKAFSPTRREIRPGHIDAAATRATAKPTTMLEAARLGLAATG